MESNLHINGLLKLASSGNIPHAILLEGEDLENSFEVSKKITKTLLSSNNLFESDKSKVISNKVEKGIHPDVFIIECAGKAKTIGVSKVRDLKETLYIKPNESTYKVYVLKDAEVLTVQAQNALLKILEEPPKYAVFILLCKSSAALIETIISRVQKFFIEPKIKSSQKDIYDESKKIVESILTKKEINIMGRVAKLVKDRKLFKDTANCLINIFSKAVLAQNGGNCFDEEESKDIYKKIAMNMSESQMLALIDELKYICFLLDSNVNINLIVSYLSIKAREIIAF